MRAIPLPVRERIVQLYERGKSTKEIAGAFGFCVAAVRRVRQQFQDRGTLQPQTHLCGRNTLLTPERRERLQKLLSQKPDATLAELEPAWTARFGLPLWICGCASWDGRIKKTLFAAEQNRPDVAEKRNRWHEELATVAAASLVFVDESGAHTKMTRLGGRAPKGQRVVGRVPHGHYQTTTLVSGIRLTGPCAPWLFEGAMDGEMFLAWVAQGLAPTLQKSDVVIMDNLATHKVQGVAEAIAAAGARLLYLPPYSPDFNPIENMWSKIKQILRSADPRTEKELILAAKTAFHAITPANCLGFFSNAQYDT